MLNEFGCIVLVHARLRCVTSISLFYLYIQIQGVQMSIYSDVKNINGTASG